MSKIRLFILCLMFMCSLILGESKDFRTLYSWMPQIYYADSINKVEFCLYCEKKEGQLKVKVHNTLANNVALNLQPFLVVVNGGKQQKEGRCFNIDEYMKLSHYKNLKFRNRAKISNIIFLKKLEVPNYYKGAVGRGVYGPMGTSKMGKTPDVGFVLGKGKVAVELFDLKKIAKKFLNDGEWKIVIVQSYEQAVSKIKGAFLKSNLNSDNEIMVEYFPINEWNCVENHFGTSVNGKDLIIIEDTFRYNEGKVIFE